MKTIRRALLVAGFLVIPAVCPVWATPPIVTKVEPPSWWIGHSWNPVRLLIEGRHLDGARLTPAADLFVGQTVVSTNANWVMVEVTISAKATPGRRNLRLTTPAGSTSVAFELRRPPNTKRRFQGFGPDDVIYLAMPDRFADGNPANNDPAISPGLFDRSQPRHYHGGDLAGVIQHLPYLQRLGVTALWLTPWYDNVNHLNHLEKYTANNQRSPQGVPSTDYHGYGAVDFYGVEEHFGNLAILCKLVDRAHRRGLKIIQDQVANHTGPYHRWTTNAPTPNWYNGTVEHHLDNTWQTWTIADPHPPADKLQSTLEGWFINRLPDLNQNNPETASYLIQNSLWWVNQTGLDAIRQDTLPYVPRSYWSRWSAALKREHPRLTILGEMWDGNPTLVAFFQGGRTAFDGVDSGVDTLFDFPLCYAIRDVFARRQPMTRLTETLAADTNYVNAAVLVTFLGLHDMPRFLHENGADLAGLKLAFTFLLTTRGTPLIYYGDELGMTGGNDPDNRRDFPGGFPGDLQNAFRASGRTAQASALYPEVRALLRLRRDLDPLRRGDLTIIHTARDSWAAVRRSNGHLVLVAINNATQPCQLELATDTLGLPAGQPLRARRGATESLAASSGRWSLNLAPRSAAIYSN